MKNIFLIGDSIRFGAAKSKSPGYGVYVKEKLAGKANIYAPDENCRFAQYTLRYLHNWVNSLGIDGKTIDVVHWNNGLWDTLRQLRDDPLTPVDMYVTMLERVHKRIRLLFPNARVIFALSTAVLEEWASPDSICYNREIEQYNRAAAELMARLGVEINDLHALSSTLGPEYRSDWVHYNEKGSKILADQVIAKIMD